MTGRTPVGEVVMASRASYEAGGWNDGRIGQAYDLLSAAIEDHGGDTFRHRLLTQIEELDEEVGNGTL